MDKETKKVICSNCNGNGYVKLPQKMPNKEQVTQCTVCNSQGESGYNYLCTIHVDADGIHRMQ